MVHIRKRIQKIPLESIALACWAELPLLLLAAIAHSPKRLDTTFATKGEGLRRVTRAHAVIRLASRVLAYRRGEPFGNGQAGFCLGDALSRP